MADQLKYMFDSAFIDRLAKEVFKIDSSFNKQRFVELVLTKEWDDLALKARASKLAIQLMEHLPYPYPSQLTIIEKVAPHFSGFQGIIFPTVIELFGLDHPRASIAALKNLTPYSTSEFAIRPFIVKYPETITTLLTWSKDKNHHVRRLASEGCRPLLPWAMKLNHLVMDPSAIIPILTNLKNDPEDYVYRSVANNLNDISKHHPILVLSLCEEWINESKTTKWVAKHALRTLLKAGNQRAMRLFGFGSISQLVLINFKLVHLHLNIGDASRFSFVTKNTGPAANFRFEFSVGYLKKNGKHNEKVFQLKETKIQTGEEIKLDKKIDFKNLSTRKHYPGLHYIRLTVNGMPQEKIEFTLHEER